MASVDGAGQHPLSLKVMRVSRPSLASHWQPFFSSSPSFSAHSTANPLSLQGVEPLSGHPKTLRDLTHPSNVLTLPTAFGAIQLGETFSCVLSVNNEVDIAVDSVQAKVEMQTGSGKTVLAEATAGMPECEEGHPTGTLGSRDSLELSVSTEIKELGQHVLACTVTYRTPPGMRPATSGGENVGDPFIQTFRKFYKFIVTNPLSVKSKIHVPKSPTALLSRNERDKIFLEVHIQNLTQGPLWFENIHLEPVEGWDVIDPNSTSVSPEYKADDANGKSIFSGAMALMPPQDMRQYIYIMTPKAPPRPTSVPVPPAPGTVIPLGRLDISWRSPMGEPGRLLTSVLSRRIPLPAPPASGTTPAPAIPPYLQRSTLPGAPRARSPSVQQQAQQPRMATPPPYRPGSPLKRATTPGVTTGTESPALNVPPIHTMPGHSQTSSDVQVSLLVLERPDDAAVRLEEPFSLRFSLAVSALRPSNKPSPSLSDETSPNKPRVITLAVQHTLPTPPAVPDEPTGVAPGPSMPSTLKKRASTTLSPDTTASGMQSPASHAGSIDVLTPRRVVSPPPGTVNTNATIPGQTGSESIMTSPTSVAARAANTVTMGGLTERLRRVALSEALGLQTESSYSEAFGDSDEVNGSTGVRLPSPYSNSLKVNGTGRANGHVQFAGSSVHFLPPISLAPSPTAQASLPSDGRAERGEGVVEFVLSFVPVKRGFARVGGLRVLLIRDQGKVQLDPADEDELTLHSQSEDHPAGEAQILGELDTVAEVWVR